MEDRAGFLIFTMVCFMWAISYYLWDLRGFFVSCGITVTAIGIFMIYIGIFDKS